MRMILLVAGAASLAGCAGRTAVATEVKTVVQYVKVADACPADDVFADLQKSRPSPLASQPMPADADVRTALTAAQLGKYEAKGAWADRAWATIVRCHTGGP